MPGRVPSRDEQDGDGNGVCRRLLSAEDEAFARAVVAADLDTLCLMACKPTFGRRDLAHVHDAQPAGSTMRSAFMEGWWVAQMMR